MKEKVFLNELIDLVQSKRNIPFDDKSPIQVYSEHRHRLKDLSDFKILILNAPCHNFGDVVFAMKLRNYIESWYNCDCKIATTVIKSFKTLGEKDINLLEIKGGSVEQCRRFKNLKFIDKNGKSIETPEFDLIFVAPLQADMTPDYQDVKKLIPYSNYFNTYFFSEYNDTLTKGFDFNTGVGKNRDGMLFYKGNKTQKIEGLNNPYIVTYLNTQVETDKCFLNFIHLVAKKYSKKYKNLDVVIVAKIGEFIHNNDQNLQTKLINIVGKYFDEINLVMKDYTENLYQTEDKVKNIINFRANVYPLPYDKMQSLFNGSLRDILITGDQSMTDVLSCCWKKKLPMYQVMPWKINFAHELAKNLPQKFLKNISTSCGNIKAIKYSPDFEKFMKSWDFKYRAKPKIDGIVAFTLDKKENETLQEVEKIFLKSKSKESILNKLEKLLD